MIFQDGTTDPMDFPLQLLEAITCTLKGPCLCTAFIKMPLEKTKGVAIDPLVISIISEYLQRSQQLQKAISLRV